MKLAARWGRVVTGRVSRHVDQLAVDRFPIADKRGGQPPEACNSMVTRTILLRRLQLQHMHPVIPAPVLMLLPQRADRRPVVPGHKQTQKRQ